ncbi:MAG: FecR domain-containing protein, partial [Alistipes sp.]
GLWKENKIVFNHTSFASAVRIIENRYNVSVRVNNPQLYDYTFSGTFIDADLDTVLRFLSLASGIEFDCSALDSASDAKQRRIIEAN